MKEISDLHYLRSAIAHTPNNAAKPSCSFLFLTAFFLLLLFSPSGCTFWGKKPWSRKKKILWQLGTLVGAPVGIALIAGIAIPAMIIGIPVYVGRKVRLFQPLYSGGVM